MKFIDKFVYRSLKLADYLVGIVDDFDYRYRHKYFVGICVKMIFVFLIILFLLPIIWYHTDGYKRRTIIRETQPSKNPSRASWRKVGY